MSRTVTLFAEFSTSSLGLGCAGLFREPSRSARRRLLAVAFDSGIRHFDVAPMYGLGLGESELGYFSRGRRGNMTIATKFGIAPSLVGRLAGAVQGPVRWSLSRRPDLSRQARERAAGPSSGRGGALLYRSTGYDAVAARRGIEASLRELATDYIDVFLLHDPQPESVRSEELCAYLDKAVTEGKIRSWGIAGETAPTKSVLALLDSAPSVVQLPYDISAPDESDASVRFGVVGPNLSKLQAHLADRAVCHHWSMDIGRDCSNSSVLAELLLRSALSDTSDGVVLYTSVREGRLREAATLADTVPAQANPDLVCFRRLVAAEL